MKLFKLLIVIIVFSSLSYFSLVLMEMTVFESNFNIVFPAYHYKLFYSLAFGLFGAISWYFNSNVKLKGMVILFIIAAFGFFINAMFVKKLLTFQISPNVVSQTELNFRMLYYFPLYPMFILTAIGILRKLNAERIIKSIPNLNTKFKVNIERFIANLVDWFIIIIFGIILSQINLIVWFPIEILMLIFAYRLVLEYTTSSSIGKSIFNLQIINRENEKATFGEILKRNAARLTIFFWIPIIAGKEGWHDRFSKTKVVKNAL